MRLATTTSATLAVALLAAAGCAPPKEGRPERAAGASAPIVGGYVDDETRGAVGLAINVLDLFFVGHCSGSLLTPNLVLTAQHCVSVVTDETPAGGVVCGATDFGTQGGGKIFRATAETVRPNEDGPAFYEGADMRVIVPPDTSNLCGFDVALIVLEGSGIPPEVATPLVPRLDAPPTAGETFSAVGYGLTAPVNGPSGTRMRIDDRTVSCVGAACGAGVWDSEWAGDATACSGDSGGPALDAEGRVIGVVSRGPSDCQSVVYGDPSAWKDLVIETALEAAELGGLEPPFWALTGESTPPPAAGPGEICLGVCDDGYSCATVGGVRQCVPACGPALPACAEGTVCDDARRACVPAPPESRLTEEGGGCGITASGSARLGAGFAFGALALLAAAARRRRRR